MRQAAWGSWVAIQTSTLDNETLLAAVMEKRHTSHEGNAFVPCLFLCHAQVKWVRSGTL